MNYKKLFVYVCMMIVCVITSCTNSPDKIASTNDAKDSAVKKDFSQVVFATKKDTSCGMPLTAGLEDTLHFNGKVYGFCSKECKDAFVTKLKNEKKL